MIEQEPAETWDNKDDPVAHKMKDYEAQICATRLNPDQPFIVRLDGHGFSKFTKGFKKPYDERIFQAMLLTTADLINSFHALTGYTQSDEISLVFPAITQISQEKKDVSLMFNGKIQKIVSLMAGYCSSRFTYHLSAQQFGADANEQQLVKKIHHAYFDARVFHLQNSVEVAENIIWRMKDCKRNSKNNLAHSHYKQNEVHGLTPKQIVDKLKAEKNVDWNSMPDQYKFGCFVKKGQYEKVGVNAKTQEQVVATRGRYEWAAVNLYHLVKPETEQLLMEKYSNATPYHDKFKPIEGLE